MSSIQDLIASANDRLTPTERRIAEVVLADSTLLAFGTVSDLASRALTSRPSIVRFATKLGFEGYTDLQSWIRDGLSRRLSSPSQRIRLRQDPSTQVRQSIAAAIQATLDVLDERRVEALAAPISTAEHVWILSGETSMAGAHALHSGLVMARPEVYLVEDQSMGRDLSGAAAGDTAVIFDFERYRRNAVTAARVLAEAGVTLVAITDGPLSPLASLTPIWCELKIPAVGPFDSAIPAVIAAELIVARVVNDLGDAARERIDRLETLWQDLGTFLHDSNRKNAST